ncbi:hypothetical protein COP2_030070 [Malus domestica]
MTTAWPMNDTDNDISIGAFAYGSGHINPVLAKILSDSKVDIKVVPEVLSFDSLNEEKDFDVTIVGSGVRNQSQVSGSLVWSDGIYSVRSPIVVYAYVHNLG